MDERLKQPFAVVKKSRTGKCLTLAGGNHSPEHHKATHSAERLFPGCKLFTAFFRERHFIPFSKSIPAAKIPCFFYFFFFFGIYLLFPWSVTFLVSTQHMNSVFTSKADGVVKDKGSVSLLWPFPTMFFWEGRGQEGAGRGSSQDQPQALCLGSLAQCRVRSTGGQEWEHPDPGEQDGNRGGFPTRCR